MSRIGAAIREARQAGTMTSAQLAERVTLTPQYIRLIECGGAVPSFRTVLAIANQFPDVDSTEWCFLLLEDLWGKPTVDAMKRWAVVEDAREWNR